jgi:hypothetical protein
MDAWAALDERGPAHMAKSRGPDAPTLASSRQAQDGQPATVATKPGTPGRSRISHQPIAQGMPACSAYLW